MARVEKQPDPVMLQDRLTKYRSKRDFTRTAEPAGERLHAGSKRRYLIQKHAARALHYDFRLEHDGVLLSWAVPRGPSLSVGDRRLAVHVEDHPIEYGDFEGTIPQGQYGGGTVMLWDRGTWEPRGDVDEGLAKGNLKFDLHGQRLKGGWALIRLDPRGRKNHGNDNWLLIKEKDAYARSGSKSSLEREATSVATGRSMNEIARGGDLWQSKPRSNATKQATSRPKRILKKNLNPAQKIPPFVAPQLATLVEEPPAGNGWLHEIKYDGYRLIVSVAGDNVLIRTRTGLDWTDKFQTLVGPLSELPCESALLDGEVVVADAEGRTDFGALQNALSAGRGNFIYYMFDLLSLNGEDLREKPLRERKEMLAELLSGLPKDSPLRFSEHIEGNGEKVFREACNLNLEGVISKRADDPYRSGRTTSWLKAKCGLEQEFIVIGWRPSDKPGRAFSSLLLAVNENGKLRYAGRVGSGYSEERLEDLSAEFAKHARKTPPVRDLPPDIKRDAYFLEPVLVAEIAFRGWTRDRLVRQGSFKGLRTDKPADEVVEERPMAGAKARASARTSSRRPSPRLKARAQSAAKNSDDPIADVRVTHPDRVVFEKTSVTKRDLIQYYLSVADLMLPHIVERPLALVRCPQGSGEQCFFQKHASRGWPNEFKEVRITEKSGSAKYLYIEDVRGLVAAAQMSVLELHLWGSHVEHVEQPDRMVFDLDPDEGLAFSKVREAARELKSRLTDVGLESFPMLTGGKGVHVVVPLTPRHNWEQHRAFAEAMARVMAEESPDRYVANMSKTRRHGKIFVDYLRNLRGSTAIAPYSTRARAGAFVALPISWASLGKSDSAHPVSVSDVLSKNVRLRDAWPNYNDVRQSLPLTGR